MFCSRNKEFNDARTSIFFFRSDFCGNSASGQQRVKIMLVIQLSVRVIRMYLNAFACKVLRFTLAGFSESHMTVMQRGTTTRKC